MYSLILPYALRVQPPESEVERVVHTPHGETPPAGGAETGGASAEDDIAKQNANVLLGIREGSTGRFSLSWRPAARVSALDAGLQQGRAVHETVAIHRGTLVQLAVCTRLPAYLICFAMLCRHAANASALLLHASARERHELLRQ